jgi:hypothetical protein
VGIDLGGGNREASQGFDRIKIKSAKAHALKLNLRREDWQSCAPRLVDDPRFYDWIGSRALEAASMPQESNST